MKNKIDSQNCQSGGPMTRPPLIIWMFWRGRIVIEETAILLEPIYLYGA